jgi:hypothetical protein
MKAPAIINCFSLVLGGGLFAQYYNLWPFHIPARATLKIPT